MKLKIAIILCIFGWIYWFSYTMTEKAEKEYQRGLQDGISSGQIDVTCTAWWLEANIKDVKGKICGKK